MKKGKGNDLMTETEATFQRIAQAIGYENALILVERHERHVAGRDLPLFPVPDFPRIPHKVGPMKETIHLPSTAPNIDFLSRMLMIEKEFFHGIRKRPWE